ncbi:MAG: 16S rRNA (guanine(527)-N(7))-methyltransferase RsmG [Opitutales bacterium]
MSYPWRSVLPQLDEAQVESLDRLAGLLREWNTRLNLVSRRDVEELEAHHLTHALLIARAVPFAPGARLLDVGTGGGLPGLPLAICYPEARFFLCDSIEKKAKAVREMVVALGLRNVEVVHKRAETLESRWDFILGRAVTALPVFLGWITKNIRPGETGGVPHGVLYLKGTRYLEELEPLGLVPWQVHDLGALHEDPYFADKFLLHFRAEELQACEALRPEPAPARPAKKRSKRKAPRRR